MTNYHEEPDQEKRLEHLRAELASVGGSFSARAEIPGDLEEEFLRRVLEYERAQPITLLQLLANAGLTLPAPDDLDEADLTIKLWEIIERMSSLGAYLLNTNHLSDRQLYEYLFNEALREEATLFPENPSFGFMIDITGSGSEGDTQLFLKHYADDSYRERWARDWPEDHMPKREDPPYDRDARLPRAPFG
ncbi:MAG: hypothetical protein ACR2LM_13185 [Pyrinomonadaceae bacterium]